MKTIRKSDVAFIAIVLLYCLYAELFILRTSFVVDGERFFSLFDDAMISMRYARNLVHGYGLAWNPGGERVEGYTNPLWVLYMSLFHLLPIVQSKISLYIQISGALFLMMNLFLVRKIAHTLSNGSTAVVTCAVFLTAFYLPLNNWSLQGMEVSLLTLIISASILIAFRCAKSNAFSIWLYVLLGIGTLVRMDMAIPYLVILLFIVAGDPVNRRRNLLYGLLVFIFFILFQTAFRLWYFGDLLPNTYYVKIAGYPVLLRISRGLDVLWTFIYRMNWILFVLPFGMLFFRREKRLLLLFCLLLMQMLYSVYVGGDAWEWWGGSNRYVCVVMPVFFVLFSCGLEEVRLFLARKIDGRREFVEKYVNYGFVALVLMSFMQFNSISDRFSLSGWMPIRRPLHVLDNRRMVELSHLLTSVTNARARIAVVWAGAVPYYSNRYAIDLLGKNDKKIAHENMRVSDDFFPGHLKWDYGYSIGELKPDIVAQLWLSQEEAKPYLDSYYRRVDLGGHTLYLLKGSENLLWDRIKNLE